MHFVDFIKNSFVYLRKSVILLHQNNNIYFMETRQSYIKRLSVVVKELEKKDNLSIPEIIKMDMLDYKNQLIERASIILKEREQEQSI